MAEIPFLVKDLALILMVAGIVTIIFKKLKQPLVLGYIVAGFLVSLIAFFIMLYALYSRFIANDYVPGWTSLIISVMFIGGIQLIGIGIIGEYIGRISANIRNRPLYVVDQSNVDTPAEK